MPNTPSKNWQNWETWEKTQSFLWNPKPLSYSSWTRCTDTSEELEDLHCTITQLGQAGFMKYYTSIKALILWRRAGNIQQRWSWMFLFLLHDLEVDSLSVLWIAPFALPLCAWRLSYVLLLYSSIDPIITCYF